MREGSYTTTVNGKQVTVSLSDGDALRDAADLWALLDGEYEGTPSTASETMKTIVGDLQAQKPLTQDQWEVFSRVKDRYGSQLAAFRKSKDNEFEGFVPISDDGRGRVSESSTASAPIFEHPGGAWASEALARLLREADPSAPASTGAMIALYPSDEVAEGLALDGGEDPDDLHLTLVFLGPASMVSDPLALRQAVGKWAARTAPMSGQVSGVGTFTSGPQPVTYASANVPGLEVARQDLVDCLDRVGIVYSTQNGFTPHITLAWDDRDADVENHPLVFDTAALVLAGDRTDFPLSGIPAGAPRMALADVSVSAALAARLPSR